MEQNQFTVQEIFRIYLVYNSNNFLYKFYKVLSNEEFLLHLLIKHFT